MKLIVVGIVSAAVCSLSLTAQAKLPAPQPTPELQAKAEEAKIKAAEAAKKEGEQLGKAQDRAADNYRKGKGRMVASARK